MAFTQFSYDMDIIAKLSDTPNVDDGLTADQLKGKFDEGGKVIKDYINNVLLQEIETPITADRIEEGAVTASKIGVSAVTSAKINNGSVIESKISDGAISTAKFASGAVAPKATQLAASRNITVQDSSGKYSGTAAGFNGSAAITLKMPASAKLDVLVAGSGLAGTSLPSSPVEGQVFFLIGG